MTVTEEGAPILAPDGVAEDVFGISVSVSGDLALVGAAQGEGTLGKAYVYAFSGGTWNYQATLTPSDGTDDDQFGGSVVLSGTTAVVGARYADDGVGAVYIYTQSGTTWTQSQKLSGTSGVDVNFGCAVAMSGSTILIGSVGNNDDEGAAYAYTWNGSAATRLGATLTAGDSLPDGGSSGDQFGRAVAISGSTAFIGAPGHAGARGAVYVFDTNGSTWTPAATPLATSDSAPDPTYNGQESFGIALAATPGSLLVGAPNIALNGDTSVGAGYVFAAFNGVYSLQQRLDPNPAGNNAYLGTAVALEGPTAVLMESSAAYVFTMVGSIWTEDVSLPAADHFTSVSLSGTQMLAGDLYYEPGSAQDQGACYGYALGGIMGAPCITSSSCGVGYACNSNLCSLPCQVCGTTGVCSPQSNGTACIGDNACIVSQACTEGTCGGGASVTCAPLDECHVAGTCDTSTGVCSNPDANDGTPCTGGSCHGGVCTPAPDAGDPDAGEESGSGSVDAGSPDGATSSEDGGTWDPDGGAEEEGRAGDGGGAIVDGAPATIIFSDAGPPPVSSGAPFTRQDPGCTCRAGSVDPEGGGPVATLALVFVLAALRRRGAGPQDRSRPPRSLRAGKYPRRSTVLRADRS